MPNVMDSLEGLLPFGVFFLISLLALIIFKLVYTRLTPHDEWHLVKEKQKTAAALGLRGAVLGFAIAIGGAASNAVDLIDFGVWSVIALIAQLIAFLLVRFLYMPKIAERIENNEISAGIMLASVSVSIGIINAACMTY